MFLRKWENIPSEIKNETTYKYYEKLQKKKANIFMKRCFDIIFSMILLIILFPIFVILAICIKIDSKGPVFYRQERVTQYNKNFRIFKFRTMVQDADKQGSLITIGNDSRITRIGKLIRKCRLDEIPQLINILIGDMSFVGTRPEVRKYVDAYTDEMKATLLMKAGVTSEASIKFKNEDEIIEKYIQKNKEKILIHANNFNENINDIKNVNQAYVEEILPKKMKYNLDYINNFNIIKDICIMFNTIFEVIK